MQWTKTEHLRYLLPPLGSSFHSTTQPATCCFCTGWSHRTQSLGSGVIKGSQRLTSDIRSSKAHFWWGYLTAQHLEIGRRQADNTCSLYSTETNTNILCLQKRLLMTGSVSWLFIEKWWPQWKHFNSHLSFLHLSLFHLLQFASVFFSYPLWLKTCISKINS